MTNASMITCVLASKVFQMYLGFTLTALINICYVFLQVWNFQPINRVWSFPLTPLFIKFAGGTSVVVVAVEMGVQRQLSFVATFKREYNCNYQWYHARTTGQHGAYWPHRLAGYEDSASMSTKFVNCWRLDSQSTSTNFCLFATLSATRSRHA